MGFKNPGFNQYSETLVSCIADDSAKDDEEKDFNFNDNEDNAKGVDNGIDGKEEEEEEDNGSEALSIERRSVGSTTLTRWLKKLLSVLPYTYIIGLYYTTLHYTTLHYTTHSLVQGKNTRPVSLPISLENLPQLNSEDVSIVDTPTTTTETKDRSNNVYPDRIVRT